MIFHHLHTVPATNTANINRTS